jgi:hypothetical protein
MTVLDVAFEVPPMILTGLSTGSLERVGGVIRNTSSKEVVVWLREIGNSSNDAVHQAGMAGLLSSSNQMLALGAGGQLLNFALTAASIQVMLHNFRLLSSAINELKAEMRSEFQRDRDKRFIAALQMARDIFESKSSYGAEGAIQGLYEARDQFLADVEDYLKRGDLTLAYHSFIRAMYATTARIRCYLSKNDLQIAHDRLIEDLTHFRELSMKLVDLLTGTNAALFFHREVAIEDLNRYLQVQRWLKSPDDIYIEPAEKTLLEIIDAVRGDFWNQTLVEEKFGRDVLRQVTRRPVQTVHNRIQELLHGLSLAEAVIENYQRLLGFEMEIRAIRLSSFEAWSNLVDETDTQHSIAFIVDREAIHRLAS